MLIDFELAELGTIAGNLRYMVVEDDGCTDADEMRAAIDIVQKICKATDLPNSDSLTMAFLSAATETYLEDMKAMLEFYEEEEESE